MLRFFRVCCLVLLLNCCNKPQLSPLIIETEQGPVTYQIEFASTEEQLRTGLMNRQLLAADSGMLFDLSGHADQPTAMWMKNTLIPLDMLFLTKEGIIFWIQENAQPHSEELIIPPFPAAAVVELNGGEVLKNKIKVGQIVKHSLFPPLKQKQIPTFTE
ncbi:MAG: DUF192 domain-containing protein [Alphaproteobacteria bacterium]|nr:DUF192 domain-containing protein [Alphaproteobacteria bacterium]